MTLPARQATTCDIRQPQAHTRTTPSLFQYFCHRFLYLSDVDPPSHSLRRHPAYAWLHSHYGRGHPHRSAFRYVIRSAFCYAIWSASTSTAASASTSTSASTAFCYVIGSDLDALPSALPARAARLLRKHM